MQAIATPHFEGLDISVQKRGGKTAEKRILVTKCAPPNRRGNLSRVFKSAFLQINKEPRTLRVPV
jgi:hypothetical protein